MNKKNIIIIMISVLIVTCIFAFARTTTTDLGLVKPTWTETIDILDDLNANSDILEAFANDPLEYDSDLERLEDRAGAMWTGNTETFIALTYQDADNTIDAVVPVKDEDNMASDSATYLATQQSIKKYVDDQAAGVSTTGTPVDDDYAKFTAAAVIEGRSYSEVRADLGLVIGTNVQAYDAGLLSIAGLTTAADKMIYTTALDTYAVTALTAFAITILDDADASAVRTTLDALQDVANAIDSNHYTDASIDHEHLAADVISGMTDVTSVDADYMLVWDATDSALKKVDMAEVRGGADTFTAMTDTPANYTNAGRKMVRVNAAGTALEFTTRTKLDAITAPTVDNDGTEFFGAGSRWVDVTNDKEYVCLDASTGAAVWTETTATATAGLPVTDTTGIAKGSVDATKIVRFEVDGLTTATTRVLTVPDSNQTIGTATAITDDLIVKADFADEDWGDMTVATNVVTIDADAVTYAKVQNVSATDKVLGRSSAGAGIIEEIVCTTFARSILDDADEATFKATVNLEIGTDVEVDLSNEAGLYAVLSDVALFLEDTIDDTSPELGGELDAGAHSIGFTQQSTTGDGTTTINWTLGNKFKFTFGAQNDTFTFTAPTNPCNILLMLIQDGTGSRTATWPGTVKWAGGTAPTLTTGAGTIDIVSFYYDGTNYFGVASLAFATP